MTNEQSIINFAYFTANFSHNFIHECWKDNQHLIDHLYDKFIHISDNESECITMGDFMKWFLQLDDGNQTKLAKWINENYNCGRY